MGEREKNLIDLVSQFYRAHDIMKRLHGDKFSEKIIPCKEGILLVQANKKCGIVEACRILCFDMKKAHPYEAGYPIAMLLATAVEMIEEEGERKP